MVMPNNTNRTKLTNKTKEEENSKNGKRDIPSKRNITSPTEGLVQTQYILGEAMKPKSSAREKPNTFAEADRYFKTLNEEEKADFDVSAAKLSPYITSLVIRRRRYFQELQEVHTVRLEGEPTFTIPAETYAMFH